MTTAFDRAMAKLSAQRERKAQRAALMAAKAHKRKEQVRAWHRTKRKALPKPAPKPQSYKSYRRKLAHPKTITQGDFRRWQEADNARFQALANSTPTQPTA